MRVAPILFWLALGCGIASAQGVNGPEITDMKFAGILPPAVRDENSVDNLANEYKYLRVFFTTKADLRALTRARERNLRVKLSRCAETNNRDYYDHDFDVYDSLGKVAANRAIAAPSNSDKFHGVYYFLLPTRHNDMWLFIPDQLYRNPVDICFEIGGGPENFYAKPEKIPVDAIKTVLAKRPN
jgi:hypothetical protein